MENVTRPGCFTPQGFLRENPDIAVTTAWMWLFRRRFIVEHGISFPEIYVGEDSPFVAKALLFAKSVEALTKVMYVYSSLPADISLSRVPIFEDRIRCGEEAAGALRRRMAEAIAPELTGLIRRYFQQVLLFAISSATDEEMAGLMRLHPGGESIGETMMRSGAREAASLYWRILIEKIRRGGRGRIFLAPAGALMKKFCARLIKSGIHPDGFLDNYAIGHVTFPGEKIPIMGFGSISGGADAPFIVLMNLNVGSNAIFGQLRSMGIEKSRILRLVDDANDRAPFSRG